MAFKRAILTTAAAASISLAFAGVAGAQQNPDYTAPAPAVEVTAAPSAPVQSAASPAAAARSGSASLAFTGSDALQLAVAGGVLVAGGAGVLAARRRATA